MIKNLLWKQAMEAATKKFGNLNTNEATKWLMDKYNTLLGKENTKNIVDKIRDDLKRDRPFEGFKPEVIKKDKSRINEIMDDIGDIEDPAGFEPEVKKFNPFKKEGKKIDFMDYYSKRKRGEFDEGGMILPQPKPYNFEEKIEFLKKIKSGVGPKTYLQLMSNYLNEGVEKEAITKEERDNFLKRFTGTISEDWTSAIDDENLYMYEGDYERYPPKFNEGGLAGLLGETQQVGGATDRNQIVKELYDKAGGFDGTGKTFEEFMADVLFEGDYLAKGGRVGLAEGDTPSQAWMRDYFYDAGYDDQGVITLDEYMNGPIGWNDYMNHGPKKYAKGGRVGFKNGKFPKSKIGLLRTGIMEALDQFTRKGDDAGDWAVNFGEVRDLFQNLDKTFAGRITSKESVDDIITRFRDTRKLDLAENIKEFLNNRIKQYKSGLENIKKYGQSEPIKEVGDHAEELKYLIKETRKDLDAIDTYGLTQQSKKATKHAEGGRAGYLKGGILKAGEFLFTTIKDLYKGKKGLQAGKIEKDLMRKYRDEGMELGDAISKANREAYEIVDNRKLEIIEEAMKKVDTASDDYIKLVDEHIRIVEPDFYKDIKRWDSYRPDLADKTRALVHPDWAAARFGSNYDDVLLRNQNRALRQQSDEINKMYPDKTDTDILVDEIDEMNKVNIDELFTGRKKNAEGGIIGLKNGGLLEKYKEYAPKGPWTRGLTDMEITYELYDLLAPYMSLFMKEGGRVGFKEGKGMSRRAFLKLMGVGAALPVVGKFFKLAKPAAKVMDDIKINLRGDGDWEQVDEMWSGGNWVNYSFEALTDKGRKILAKLSKGKNASLVDQGDGVYFPGKTVKSKAGNYLTDEADYAVDAVDSIKKAKGNISLNTQVGSKVKGAKPEKYKDMDLGYSTKTYGSKEITKKNILEEADDLWVGDYGGYKNKGFYDENVEDIIDIITKKAEGGRVGLFKGGIIDLLIKGGKFLNKNSPVELYKKYLKSVKDRTLKANETGKFTDLPLEVIPIGAGGALVTNYLKKKLKSLDEQTEEKAEGGRITDYSFDDYMREREMLEKMRKEDKLRREFEEDMRRKEVQEQKQWAAEGGRIGLDAGGPPVSPANLHPLQRPMFYQGGLTKTVPPKRGPMPQGLQSNVYDGIMRPGVINGRN